jgi:hypothetical protein
MAYPAVAPQYNYNVPIPKPVNRNTYENQTQNYYDNQYTNRYLNVDYNIQRTNTIKDFVTVTPRMNVNTVYGGYTYNQVPLTTSYSGYAPPPPQIYLAPQYYGGHQSYGGGYGQQSNYGGYQPQPAYGGYGQQQYQPLPAYGGHLQNNNWY